MGEYLVVNGDMFDNGELSKINPDDLRKQKNLFIEHLEKMYLEHPEVFEIIYENNRLVPNMDDRTDRYTGVLIPKYLKK